MSLPINNKKANSQAGKSSRGQLKGSKFIKGGASSKPVGPEKKVRSTGANRGS